MSSGAFVSAFYESDSGEIYNVRVQPETLSNGFQGTPPTGPATGEPSAIINGSRRRIGVNCRCIRLEWTGTPPSGYLPGATVRIPILDPNTWAAISKGDEAQYLTVNAKVIGKTPEFIN